MNTSNETIGVAVSGAGAGTMSPLSPADTTDTTDATDTTEAVNSIISASACPLSPHLFAHKKKKLVIRGSPAFSHSIPMIDLTIPELSLDGYVEAGGGAGDGTGSGSDRVQPRTVPNAAKKRRTAKGERGNGRAGDEAGAGDRTPASPHRERSDISDFMHPSSHSAKAFESANFNAHQLKLLCRHHKLNVSGVKETLRRRISDYLKNTASAVNIQRIYRGHLNRKYIESRGEGFVPVASPSPPATPATPATPAPPATSCINDTDFLSLDELSEIPHYQFFSFKDVDGHIYGFDIRSAYNLFCSGKHSKGDIFNPYNRKEIPESVVTALKRNITLAKILRYPVEIEVKEDDSTPKLTPEQQFTQSVLSLTQEIDALGNYTDITWFTGLTHRGWQTLVEHIGDIWIYRSNLPDETRREFFPPNGKPFIGLRLDKARLLGLKESKELALTIMKRFISSSRNIELRKLGALYVLGALTIVCPAAARAMPWLHESFS